MDRDTKRAFIEAQLPIRRQQAYRASRIGGGYFVASAVGAALIFNVAVSYDERVEKKVTSQTAKAVRGGAENFVKQYIPYSDMRNGVLNADEGEGVRFEIEISPEDVSKYKDEVKQGLTARAEIQLNFILASALLIAGGGGYMAQKYGRRSRQKFKRVQSMKRHLHNLDHE